MNESLYKLGVIGAGMIARQHLEHIRTTGRAEVSWIAALRPGNLEEVRSEFGIKYKSHDYRDMLKDPRVDAILITTPPHLHKEMFIEALRAGKHVLLEKPMAIRPKDLNELLDVRSKYPPTACHGVLRKACQTFAQVQKSERDCGFGSFGRYLSHSSSKCG